MLTPNDFKRWKDAITIAGALKDGIVNKLRFVWDDYKKIYQGDDDEFPHDVNGLEIIDKNIHVYGWVGSDPDMRSCYIPLDFAYSDEETRAKIVLETQEKFKEEKENAARLKEEKERAEYKRLQAKFGAYLDG